MAKFCTKCGSQLEEGANACASCGAIIGQPAPTPAEPTATTATPTTTTTTTAPNPNTSKYIGIGVVAVAVIIVLAIIVNIFGGPAYEKPLDYFFKGIQKQSWNTFSKAFTDDYLDAITYFVDDTDDYMEDMYDDLVDDYGKRIKISYKVVDKEKADKDELELLQGSYNMLVEDNVKIKKAYTLEVELTIKGKDDKVTRTVNITVIKIKSKWYMLSSGRL